MAHPVFWQKERHCYGFRDGLAATQCFNGFSFLPSLPASTLLLFYCFCLCLPDWTGLAKTGRVAGAMQGKAHLWLRERLFLELRHPFSSRHDWH